MNPVIKPISVILKEARQNRGVSLEEAYKATKIHPKILRALEDGTTLGLSYVYVRSYIKIYAKFLGINQHELDKYFQPVAPKEKKVPVDVHFKVAGEKIQNLSLPNINILANLRIQIIRFKKIIIVAVIFLVLLIISKSIHRKDAIVSKKISTKEIGSVVQIGDVKSKSKKEIEKESFPKINDVLRLTIFAELDTWMQVKVDGKVVFKRTLKEGTSETWQAKDSLELWLANAGTVKLELNGKILAPIGRRGQLLKSVLITKEGLTIQKK